jgi:hypothetical protein
VIAADLAPGGSVLLRGVYGDRVRWAFPHLFALEHDGRLGFFVRPGTPGVWMGRDPDGRYLERWVRGDDPRPHAWTRTHVLWLVRPADAHSVGLFWDEDWQLLGWYVNLQAPLRRTPLGFDTTDWALDVWVEPDGSWRWKDEADFAEAQALGVLDANAAAAVRAEGERVVAARPWPTGLEAWRPDPAWPTPELPDGWDRV